VIAAGRTQSGKTEFVWRRYVRREPRVLIIDPGEWRMKRRHLIPGAIFVQGADGVHDAMMQLVEERRSRWIICADADTDDLLEIQDILIPPRDWDASPVPALGGLAVFMDEVDLSMPLKDNRLAGYNRRGRHVQLSVYMATQRLGAVNKECTSMAEFIAVMSFDEPRDVQYLRDRLGRIKADEALAWANSGPYRCSLYHTPTGQLFRLPAEPD
jgi:hypothetical protein